MKIQSNARAAAAAILVAGFVASLIVNWPGHLEYDSVIQLLEGRSGVYGNWHPPVMSWLLGISDAISPDAAAFVLFNTAVSFGAILSLLWLVRHPAWPAIAASLVVVLLPQMFLFQAIVWKDILFADACLAGFVCLAHAAAQWDRQRMRFALLGGAALFITLGMLTRQNGAVILPCAAVTLAAIAGPDWQTRLRYGAGLLATCAVLAGLCNAALQLRATRALGATEQIEDLQLYDIAGMLQRDPHMSIAILEHDKPAMARLLHDKGARLYTPAAHDALQDKSGIGPLMIPSLPAVARQWRASVWAHPLDYLAVRGADFSWLFFSAHADQCPVYTTGIDGPAAEMKALGLAPRFDARDEALGDYADALIGTPVFSHPFFAILGLGCFVLLLRRRRPADLAMAGLLAAAALYTASYFVVSFACEYRYLFVLDLSAIAAVFYLAADITKRLAPSA
jgi:hypothetical protein